MAETRSQVISRVPQGRSSTEKQNAPRSSTPSACTRAGSALPREGKGPVQSGEQPADSPLPKGSKVTAPSFKVIYLTVFLDFFANGIVLPILQTHAKDLGSSGFNVGMVFTAYSAAQIPGSFMFGRISDFLGRRPVILLSLVMSMVTFGLTLVAPDFTHLVAARALAGFFSETSVCQAYIADKTTKENRPAAFGHMGAFIGLAFVVGPATGALLANFGGFSLAVKFTIWVTAINLIYACIQLDESLGFSFNGNHKKDSEVHVQAHWGRYINALIRPMAVLVVTGQFAVTLAFMGWDTTFGLWAKDRLGYTQRHTGLALSWVAVGFFLASWKVRSYAKKPANTLVGGILGCGLTLAGLVGHQIVYSTLTLLVPLFCIGFGYALSEIIFQTLISVHSPRELQGSMLGTLSASQALARAVAPVLTGHLFDIAPLMLRSPLVRSMDIPYCILAIAPGIASVITLMAYTFMPLDEPSKKAEHR